MWRQIPLPIRYEGWGSWVWWWTPVKLWQIKTRSGALCLGQCISRSLVCNGDQDCEEDGLDEQCPPFKYIVCNKWIVPPNIELLGNGWVHLHRIASGLFVTVIKFLLVRGTILVLSFLHVTLVLFWLGSYDMVTGKFRGSVINTKSFGGQCRTFYSEVHNNFYRLPQSVLQYTVTVCLHRFLAFTENYWSSRQKQQTRSLFF